ncbi:MAG: DUF368 domain-containing protein [Anaerolineae bacterium]|nr:DUF368 domain-containing protein [Anaerolineae bacterium]
MRYFVLILKGMAYGITHIVPGLGGGLILILLGIYQDFVEALGNILVKRDKWKEYLAFLLPLGVGMVLGMLILAKIITIVLERYPAATMFFFMGLLIGTLPSVFRMHKDMRFSLPRGAALLLGFLLVVLLKTATPANEGFPLEKISTLTGSLYNLLISFLAGGASVTPGLDGSYILLLGGTYSPVIQAVAELSNLIIHWGALLSTGIGAVLGIIIFSKLIDTALKRAPALSYYCIAGLIVGSVYGLWPHNPLHTSIWGLGIAFLIGVVLAFIFSRPETENPPESNLTK